MSRLRRNVILWSWGVIVWSQGRGALGIKKIQRWQTNPCVSPSTT